MFAETHLNSSTYSWQDKRLSHGSHKPRGLGSTPRRATKDFNILLLFLSVYKDLHSEILDGRVVAKLWVNIGSNIF